MSKGRIRIGIGGWTYPPWRGTFYPEGLPQRQELEYASNRVSALGPKLGPALWLLSAHRRFDYDDIARFFDLLPREWDGLTLRHAIEPRHESFNDDKFFSLCRERNIAVVFGESDEFPCIDADTADFTYARLQRMREEIPTGYDEASLTSLADRAKRWVADGRDAYIFMINGAKVRAPAAALALEEALIVR